MAHQPRMTEEVQTIVQEPEISKAYYGQLKGVPHRYIISSGEAFSLYVNILAPVIEGQKKDLSVLIIKDGNASEPVATLDGENFEWTQFFEPFGYDNYWMGPEYKADVGAGKYEITVSSRHNDSKYSLAIGELEAFDFEETMNALRLIPVLKRDFFNECPANFIFSPFGWGLILIMYLLAFVVGFIYRLILKRVAKSKVRKRHKNIGRQDRLLRAVLGVALLVWAISTTWNPLLLFLSGFTFFEAIFSWCGFYAAIGKNTCPL